MINKNKNNKDNNSSPLTKVGEFIVDSENSEVVSGNNKVKLEPLPFAFLCFLIERRAHIVSREELLEHVWQNRVVSDDSIRKVVKKLREAFGDDAKSPKYIKTIPLKGYCLVAKVEDKSRKASSSKILSSSIVFAVLIITAITLFFFQYRDKPARHKQNAQASTPSIVKLTNLSGSEIPGDYSESLNQLIFLFRNNNNEPWQLHTKNLETGLVTRLTWDDSSYGRVFFSPDSKKVAYSRSEKQGDISYIADFDPLLGISNEVKIIPDIQDSYLISWAESGDYLYISLSTVQDSMMALHTFNIKTNTSTQLTYPNVEGYGDYYAKESPNGEYLALFRNIADRSYAMLLLEIPSMKIKAQQALTFYPSELVWHADSTRFAISSFKGDFYHYDLATEQLTEQLGSRPGINDVFYTCGSNCFYMRQHDMNYNEIIEIQNPFSTNVPKPTLRLESTKAEFNPIYNPSATTIFYTSKDEYQASLIRHKLGESPETLYQFNPRHILTQLSINKQETHLIGKVEDRIFMLDLTTKKFSYITTALEIVKQPTWNAQGNAIYFSRIEQHHPVLLKYDLSTDKLTREQTNIISRIELNDGRVYIINEKEELHQLALDGTQKFIVKLPVTYSNYWQFQGEYLYFSSLKNNNAHLNRLHLTSGDHQIKMLSKNNWRGEFYLHPSGDKLLTTQSVIGNSNLIKLQWPE